MVFVSIKIANQWQPTGEW